jgi:hypothetical protein
MRYWQKQVFKSCLEEMVYLKLKKQIYRKNIRDRASAWLGYTKYSKEPKEGENRRKDSYDKTLLDGHGQKLTTEVSRD